jgi:hypothetical protein
MKMKALFFLGWGMACSAPAIHGSNVYNDNDNTTIQKQTLGKHT